MEGLGRIERTDGDVISVKISERKLRSSSAGIHMWLFFQPADESARPRQGYVKVVDPEEQEEAIARLGAVGACQRGMLVGTPLVETEQDVPSESMICPKSSWAGAVSGKPSSDWYNLKLWGTSATPMIVHVRFILSLTASPARHKMRREGNAST